VLTNTVEHDRGQLEVLIDDKSCMYVFDRGYLDYERFDRMTNEGYSLFALSSFIIAIALLSFSLTIINMGIAFAIWSGLSIVFNNVFNIVVYKEEFSLAKLRGLPIL